LPGNKVNPESLRGRAGRTTQSIAVLPFANMSGDPEQEYFADGMVEDSITALSRFRQLFVIARNSTFTYKGRAVDVRHVAKELGVRYVLEGSVRKAGHRVRITGQLIDATTGAHLWAERFGEESRIGWAEALRAFEVSLTPLLYPDFTQELVWRPRSST
jgi:TolB-like protein